MKHIHSHIHSHREWQEILEWSVLKWTLEVSAVHLTSGFPSAEECGLPWEVTVSVPSDEAVKRRGEDGRLTWVSAWQGSWSLGIPRDRSKWQKMSLLLSSCLSHSDVRHRHVCTFSQVSPINGSITSIGKREKRLKAQCVSANTV